MGQKHTRPSGNVRRSDHTTQSQHQYVGAPPDYYPPSYPAQPSAPPMTTEYYQNPPPVAYPTSQPAQMTYNQYVCNKYQISEFQFKSLQRHLQGRDFKLFIDDSASMNLGTCISDTLATAYMLLELTLMFDDDGIDIYFINQTSLNRTGVNSTEMLNSIINNIQWEGSTLAGKQMNNIVNEFILKYPQKNKPVTVIYIGDGRIDDTPLFTQSIVNGCKKFQEVNHIKPISFQLYQVGNNADATAFFAGLDDDLKTHYGLDKDSVDTVNHDSMQKMQKSLSECVLKTLLGSLVQEIDESVRNHRY